MDAQGSVVWQAAYLPYGEAKVLKATVQNNLRFPGQYFDAETGLHYNWNRYYDPETGRYITADPIGLAGGMNVYAYVGGNPVNAVDVAGLAEWDKTAHDFWDSVGIRGGFGRAGIAALMSSFIDIAQYLDILISDDYNIDMNFMYNYLQNKALWIASIIVVEVTALKINLKPWRNLVSALKRGRSLFTSFDKKHPRFVFSNPQTKFVVRYAGEIGRAKPVGAMGTLAAGAAGFSAGVSIGILIDCSTDCEECPFD